VSRNALNDEQFDLLIATEKELEHKRRQDRSVGGERLGQGHVFQPDAPGSKWCAVCGHHGSVTKHPERPEQ
jgi:hypothetical protein